MSFQRIGVIGAGAWGTALGLSAARAGRDVILWGHEAVHMNALQKARSNEANLPGIALPESIAITANSLDLANCDLYLAVVPAQELLGCLKNLQPVLSTKAPIVLCAKGFDYKSGAFFSDRVKEIFPNHQIGILSGPSFAADVANGLPTAVSLAFEDGALAGKIAEALQSKTFRPYSGNDLRGVEIGGALKNVLAIAAGIVTGCGLGMSARAALIARGFAEMQRFGVAHNAKAETFSGLSGLGDLVLTATSEQSRNLRFGIALGKGESARAAEAKLGTVEGIATAHAALLGAKKGNIDMPVTEAVANILENKESIVDAISRLMMRPLKAE
jgi:glycerol-3-phosphate dehydrogenase (NAD(P)+)